MPKIHLQAAVTASLLTLTFGAASAAAGPTQALPLGGQVNDDLPSSIDPAKSAGVSDVVGGALTAGGVPLPWATFEQQTGGAQQVFVRVFKDGAWKTQGFPASLNIDTTQDAEAPAIDFAGPNRTVPWATWYEPSTKLPGGATNIFASRFSAASNVWIPEGQDRAPANKIPSLNIHTDRTAENPAIAGGTTVPGAAPGPWIAWEENDGAATDGASKRQIFVSKPVKSTDCSGNAPGGGTSVSAFCWQQTGFKRLHPTNGSSSATGDPSLNIDPSRDGIEPDIAFTGPDDKVPWVVWYEEGPSGLGGRDNAQIFAAKGIPDAAADGGIKWIAEGNGTAGQGTANVLDRSEKTRGFGNCLGSKSNEDACSLNRVPTNDAIDPRVAAGTLTPGGATVPFVTWAEDNGSGVHQIFVSRLVGGDHFELLNNGQPISNTVNDSVRPDITFSGNTPYVTWLENVGGVEKVFVSHLEGSKFVLDTPTGIAQSAAGVKADLRAPISSGCTANPFTADGSACPSGAAGTPFFLFTQADSPSPLQARAYEPSAVTTGGASGVESAAATVAGSVNPGGATVLASFEFGTSTAYGQETTRQRLAPASSPTAFSAALSGLPAATVVHYRSVVRTDFGTFTGPDQTLTTTAAPVPPVPTPSPRPAPTPGAPAAVEDVSKPVMKLKKSTLRSRRLKLTLTCPPDEVRCSSTITLTAKGSKKRLARTLRVKLDGGKRKKVTVRVSKTTNRLLARKRVKKLVLTVRTKDAAGNVATQKRTIKVR